jgi:glycosyltransferase involved in cell wall biosynthesis
MTPDVTVLIASHRSQYLKYALQSVWDQTIDRNRVQLLVNYCTDPANFHHAWNDMAKIARGRYLCILGDDDTLEPHYFLHTIAALDSTGADICYTNVKGAHRDAQHKVSFGSTYRPPYFVEVDDMAYGNKIWQSSVVRKAAWERVGGYDMDLEYVHDWDFWIRVLKSGGQALYVPIDGWMHYTHDGPRVTTSSNRERAFAALHAKHPDLFLQSQA